VNAARPLEPKREWHVLNVMRKLAAEKGDRGAARGMAARQRQIIAAQNAKKKGKK
jgi:hypothetical protein